MRTKKDKTQNNLVFEIFDLYNELKASNNLITYKKLVASVLLECKLGFDSDTYKEFVSMYNEGLKKKFNLILDRFIITFNVNLKISSEALVPMISEIEDSNSDSINLKSAKTNSLNNFLSVFNNLVNKLLDEYKYIEILPKIIIFKSENSDSIKIVFDKEHILFGVNNGY